VKINRRILVVAFLLAMVLPAAVTHAGRIVAVGDVHGSFDGLNAILRETGIIDEKARWAGGDATYIQLGDVFDRGLEVREVLDLLMRLETEAAEAGGKTEMILGNHESMNLLGFFRDANPDVYATFADAKSKKRQKKLWSAVKKYRDQIGEPTDEAAEEAWKAEHPLGWVEYVDALSPGGRYGQWLRERPVAVMIDGVLFVHGGLGPQVAGQTVEEINDTARSELAVLDRARKYLVSNGILPPTADVILVGQAVHEIIAAAELPDSADVVRRHADQLREVADIDSWSLLSPDGPLWFRGATLWSEEEHGEEMAALLDGIGATAMVVGHTPDADGRIQVRFGGRVFLIDTGMLSSYYTGGRPSALEIEHGVFTAIYLDGREVLVGDEALGKAAELVPVGANAAEYAAAGR
jgi:hypothetical protein